MMFLMLVAGIGLVLAGLLATAYGIGVQLSTGNTLIIVGVIGVCTGLIMLGFWTTVRELKNIARRLGNGVAVPQDEALEEALEAVPPAAAKRGASTASGGFATADPIGSPGTFSPAPSSSFSPAPPPPWQDEAVLRDHPIPEPLHPVEPPPPPPPSPAAAKPKRNLMFSSTSRKERERPPARPADTMSPEMPSPEPRGKLAAAPPVETAPAPFDDAWPRADRAKPNEMPPRRSGRMPPALGEAGPTLDHPEVTVLKSGIVDGMAYSLYSDGSIEAQMPEGMMRFASIDELRVHLDQRS